MDGGHDATAGTQEPAPRTAGGPRLFRTARIAAGRPDAARHLAAELGPDLALVLLFVSTQADFAGVMASAQEAFPGTEILGCTTAGEIAGAYVEGEIVAVGLPARDFAARVVPVEDLTQLDGNRLIGDMIRARQILGAAHSDFPHEFAYLMVDGTSFREDALMAVVSQGLGPVPLFGGSAGDGTRFRQSQVAHGARVRTGAAHLAFIRTRCPIRVFSLDHLDVGSQRMVVTRADPQHRRVQQINGAPAATEYARILGKDPRQLDPFTFAAHPLVVRAGGRYHVRSIQRVVNDTDLVFFSAIDEGVVLTLSHPRDIAGTLSERLGAITAEGRLDGIIACDCILRRIEAQQKQASHAVADVLRRHRVTGYSTYGEQFGAMHVNLTMTGVAIFHPEGE